MLLTICQYLICLSPDSTSEAVKASVESMEISLGLGHDTCTWARFARNKPCVIKSFDFPK